MDFDITHRDRECPSLGPHAACHISCCQSLEHNGILPPCLHDKIWIVSRGRPPTSCRPPQHTRAIGTLWEVSKIYWAWAKKRQPGLFLRTCLIAVPACLVWGGGVAAGLLVSRSVAYNPSYGPVLARVEPNNCGLWTYSDSPEHAGAIRTYQQAETHRARTYVNNFYANTPSSFAARSIFPQTTLPYNVTTSAPCPVVPAERCWLGPNGAFSMSTDLDSHNMLGINAKQEDRISLRRNVTCSPVHIEDRVEKNIRDNRTFLDFFLGPILDGTVNKTWSYYFDMPTTNADYLLWRVSWSRIGVVFCTVLPLSRVYYIL